MLCNGAISTNVNNLPSENQITLFSNPTTSEVFLQINQNSFANTDKINIFSSIGHQIYASNLDSHETKIDLSNFPKGIYILVANVNDSVKSFKILKQ